MSLLSNLVQLSGLWWLLWEDKASQLSHQLWDTIFLPQLSQSNIHGTLEGFSSQSFTHLWAKFLALFIICARLEFRQRPELPLKETRWWSIVNWNTAFSLLSLCCTPLVTQSWCSHSPHTSRPCALFHTTTKLATAKGVLRGCAQSVVRSQWGLRGTVFTAPLLMRTFSPFELKACATRILKLGSLQRETQFS